MSKHPASYADAAGHVKRQKLHGDSDVPVEKSSSEIQTPDQLRHLLVFQQDAGPKLRQNIQCFKLFLEAIAYGNDSPDRVAKQTILLKYLKAETPPEDDRSAIYLTELIQTWGFAAQSNNEGLLSALPALLALLLKTISSLIDFRDYGVLLCKTLLRKDQLKLFDRALTANKTKEHLISPCLRLLTEIVSFDGGSSARSLYLHRDISFKRLEIFLRMRKQSPGSTADDQRRPSVRRNAQKYLLANLRLQDPVAKADILSQSKIVRGLLEDLSDDPPEAICDVLGVLKKNVVSDESLPRIAKSRLLTDWTLSRIATLYGYDQDGDDLGEIPDIKALAHAFLLFVCTSLNHGVLVAQRGWYPPGAAASDAIADVNDDSAGIAELASQDRYTNRVPVRNTTLAAFLQVLRPYASSLQSDLALAIFEAAPELVADYFFKKKNFSFDPKLSATWIGYAAFLFSTIRLPIPSYKGLLEGADRPFPPVSIVIESILPQTLNHKSLTKCLNQNTSLITLFAIRLMTIAFQKLEKVLVFYSSPDSSNGSQRYKQQKQAALSLKAEFCRRCAEMKHVIAVFRNCSRENFVLREAVSRLLALYYKVIPQIALDEKFDISVVLSEALTNLGSGDRDVQDSGLCRLELKHLLDIAHRSPDMRWWQEPESMSLSPFTTILRLHINATGLGLEDNVRALLGAIIRDNAILQQATETSSLDALLASLGCYGDWRASDTVYGFLDNCILRLVRKPIKYCGDVANIANISSSGDETQGTENITISLLLIVILEQWSFLVNTAKATDLISVAHWLARYLEFSKHIGEDLFVLHHIRDQLRIKVQDKDCRLILKNALAVPRKIRLPDMVDGKAISTGPETDTSLGVARQRPLLIWDSISNSVLPSAPPDEAEDYPGLNRWTQKDLSNAVEENAVGDLLLCLCSKEEEVRRQAILNLRILMRKLEVSGYSEWQQIYLLLGEVIETVNSLGIDEPFPYFGGSVAARCVRVLADPLHFMYQKVNKFLNKSPQWNTIKLPSYWVDRIFLHPPVEDNAHQREVEWLLDTLLEGLRTPADMELYRRCHVFERLLSISASPSLPHSCVRSIIDLFFRCTYLDGSTTLITRCGILSWIRGCIALREQDSFLLRNLTLRVYQTSDQGRIAEWSNGTVSDIIDSIVGDEV